MNHADIVALVYSELLKVAGGAAVLLAALSAFLGRIWITRIASREAAMRDAKLAELKASFERQGAELKARLDVAVQRTVFVDKLQFEHEYKIYQQAWEHLFALRHATLALRPRLDTFDPAENKQDRMKRRMGDFATCPGGPRSASADNRTKQTAHLGSPPKEAGLSEQAKTLNGTTQTPLPSNPC